MSIEINESIWRRFIECECHTEGIMVSYDDTDPFPNIYLAMFSYGKFGNSLGFREKLRYCWKVLKTGRPFEDEVMLRQDTARELANALLEFANKKFEDKK